MSELHGYRSSGTGVSIQDDCCLFEDSFNTSYPPVWGIEMRKWTLISGVQPTKCSICHLLFVAESRRLSNVAFSRAIESLFICHFPSILVSSLIPVIAFVPSPQLTGLIDAAAQSLGTPRRNLLLYECALATVGRDGADTRHTRLGPRAPALHLCSPTLKDA